MIGKDVVIEEESAAIDKSAYSALVSFKEQERRAKDLGITLLFISTQTRPFLLQFDNGRFAPVEFINLFEVSSFLLGYSLMNHFLEKPNTLSKEERGQSAYFFLSRAITLFEKAHEGPRGQGLVVSREDCVLYEEMKKLLFSSMV